MSISASKPIVISSGDPAGIGPDLCLQLRQFFPDAPLLLLGDRDVLTRRAQLLGIALTLQDWQPGMAVSVAADSLSLWHCPADVEVVAGIADAASAAGTLNMLERACDGCLQNTFSAMVTAPIAKHLICEGVRADFTGHTEFLAERAGVERVVMMLTCAQMRVALATTHLPLRAVADAINGIDLGKTLHILEQDLRDKFALPSPRILVLGLNPHAGENGHLGDEEINIITPLLNQLRAGGMQLTGPLPADTAFNADILAQHDAVLAMYHDQGLPVLKYAGFGEAVNITLGLPFIRTSVDHGTAFDLAGTGKAKVSSLVAATRLAIELAQKTSTASPA